jgi:hypothetical protein
VAKSLARGTFGANLRPFPMSKRANFFSERAGNTDLYYAIKIFFL